MSNELEGRVARVERAIGAALGTSLAEFDDSAQAEARIKQDAKNQEAEDKQLQANVDDANARQANADAAAERQLASEEQARAQENAPPAPTTAKARKPRRKAKRSTDQPAAKQTTGTGELVSGQRVETEKGIRDVTTPERNSVTGGSR